MNTEPSPCDYVPRRLHHIWVGERGLPVPCKRWIKSWADTHPGWEQTVWTDRELASLSDRFICRHALSMRQNPALRSDILRLELLYLFGGIYADTDFSAARYLGHLFQPGCFHYADERSGRPGNAFMAAPPGHPFVRACLEHLAQTVINTVDTRQDWAVVVRLTGPEFLAAALKLEVVNWSGVPILDRGVQVGCRWPNNIVSYWCEYFYPYAWADHPWHEYSPERYPMSYTAHHWLGTWQDQHP